MLTSVEAEALAKQCSDASFREGLRESTAFAKVQATLTTTILELKTNITRGNKSLKQVDGASDEDDGISYSFQVDKDNTNDLSADGLSHMATIVYDPEKALVDVELITSVFRFLRNCCASCQLNQEMCRELDLLSNAHDVVMHCCVWMDVEDMKLQSSVVVLSQVALQFHANAIAGSPTNQSIVWSYFFPEDFQKVLVECHAQRKIVAFTTAVLLNCVNTKTEDIEDLRIISQRCTDLICARNLIITLLQRCLTQPNGSSVSSGSCLSIPIDEHDPAFEWIFLLFRVLFEAGHYRELYNAVGAHMLSRLWSRVTPEQLIFLRILTMWILANRSENSSIGKPFVPNDCDVCEFAYGTWTYLTAEDQDDRPEDVDETRQIMWLKFESEAKLLLLDIMGELTLKKSMYTMMEKVANERESVILLSLLNELHRVSVLRPLGHAINSNLSVVHKEPNGYRAAIIRVVGNMCYRQKSHQDTVRNHGFLPLFLNHCNIDEANPMLREWSLVALRHLCEGNEENQHYITALRPQGLDEQSAQHLEKAGMKAEIDKDSVRMLPR